MSGYTIIFGVASMKQGPSMAVNHALQRWLQPRTIVGADGRTNLFILPITSKEPRKDRLAIEIPQMERKRALLASDMRLWVMLDEYNHDCLETSFYFDPNGRQGAFSPVFTKKALGLFVEAMRNRLVKAVPRHDD